MYHPTRGGARGGAAEFSWDKVKSSKDREFYLGNSVAAPTGRWQDGRDINWYNKDASSSTSAADERREELRRIKEAETAALYAKLGRPPPPLGGDIGERLASGSGTVGRKEGTGANRESVDGERRKWGKEMGEEVSEADKKLARKFARDEVRRRRAAAAGETDARDAERKVSGHDDANRNARRRHHGHERHGRHHRSERHRDDDQGDKPHHGQRQRRSSRSRSRSPVSFRRHRRDDGEERQRARDSPSRQERRRDGEGSGRHRHQDGDMARQRSRRD